MATATKIEIRRAEAAEAMARALAAIRDRLDRIDGGLGAAAELKPGPDLDARLKALEEQLDRVLALLEARPRRSN